MGYAHDMTRNSNRGECEILSIAEEFLKRRFEYVVPTGLTFENFLGADFECTNKLERVHFVDVKGCRNVDGSNIEIDVELVDKETGLLMPPLIYKITTDFLYINANRLIYIPRGILEQLMIKAKDLPEYQKLRHHTGNDKGRLSWRLQIDIFDARLFSKEFMQKVTLIEEYQVS